MSHPCGETGDGGQPASSPLAALAAPAALAALATLATQAPAALATQAPAAEAPPVDADDCSDVGLALRGDHEAYARLVRRHQGPIAAYMWRFTRDRRQWEELVHDVFVEAYFSLGGYAGRAPFGHWLKRIATRVGYRWWEVRHSRGREMPLSARHDAAAPPSRSDAIRDAAELVHRLLGQLPPRDRLVMTLLYLESNSVAEIAELTGWSQSLVKVQAHRARQRLSAICSLWEIEI